MGTTWARNSRLYHKGSWSHTPIWTTMPMASWMMARIHTCFIGFDRAIIAQRNPARMHNTVQISINITSRAGSFVIMFSSYRAARGHAAFRAALRALESKLVDGEIVVENPKRDLAKFAFCTKGQPSRPATKRYHEILKNLGR